MLTGFDTLLVVKPIGLFFLKQALEEHTTDLGLMRIVNTVNKKLAGNRAVRPAFEFKKVDNIYHLEIYEHGFSKQPNRYIATIELMSLKNEKIKAEYLTIYTPEEAVEEVY